MFAKDKEEHDRRLTQVLKRLESANIMLNPRKCELSKTSMKYIIDRTGVKADPDKTDAIREMESPESVSDLRKFLGMENQMGKFSLITEGTASAKHAWLWGPEQENAFS